MTRTIAGKDLRVLWASPLPYVVGALLHVALGVLYVEQLVARRQAVIQPMFPLAAFLLILMVPVLAMRALAEEARTGTLDLLQAIPVPARRIVVGKWLAVWLTTLVVLAPSLVFVGLLAWWGDPDAGPITAGFLGLAMLAAALSAVGVAASSFTSSQPVAAMTALFVALLLWFMQAGTDRFGLSSLSIFSFSERLRSFAGGVIDTSDVAFFGLVSVAALAIAEAVTSARTLR